MKCQITVKDEVWSKIDGLKPEDHTKLMDKMAIYKDGYQFMPLFKLGHWDGKIRYLDRFGNIYTNLIPMILDDIEYMGYDLSLDDKREDQNKITGQITFDWFLNNRHGSLVKFELRPYQVEAANLAIEAGQGFIEASTGSGKTSIIAAMCSFYQCAGLKTIVIVPSSDLIIQTRKLFEFLGIDTGEYSGETKVLDHSSILSTWQALQYNPTIMRQFDVIIVDEAHGASAKVVGELLTKHGNHAKYRFGFTGTFPKPKVDQYTLIGSIGEILYRISASMLIEQGYLAKLNIEPIEIVERVENFPDYVAEKAYLNKNKERLDIIADIIITRCLMHGNTLVLVNSIKQGQELQSLIKDSVFLCGADDNDVRAEWYSTFEDRDDLIVIATSGIASTGISIDRVFCLIMVDAGKSFIKCIQSIGRGLRKGKDKDSVSVLDIYTSLSFGKKHAKERFKYYREASYPVDKVKKVKKK